MEQTVDWQALRAPFKSEEVDFRVQKTFEHNGKVSALVVAYIDARVVQDRLDEVIGPEHWHFDWQPLKVRDDGVVLTAKGTLTIHGIAKSDIGDASDQDPSKGCVSDAFKRAAVHWGIGRYLYSLGATYGTPEQKGKSWILPESEINRLRANLRGASTPTAQQPRQAQRTAAQTHQATAAPAQPAATPARPRTRTTQTERIFHLQDVLGIERAEPAFSDEANQLITELTEQYNARWKHIREMATFLGIIPKKPAEVTNLTAYIAELDAQRATKRAADAQQPTQPAPPTRERQDEQMASDRQLTSIRMLCAKLGRPEPDPTTLTFGQARDLLTQLSRAYSEARAAS
jgi:hypothetical protein